VIAAASASLIHSGALSRILSTSTGQSVLCLCVSMHALERRAPLLRRRCADERAIGAVTQAAFLLEEMATIRHDDLLDLPAVQCPWLRSTPAGAGRVRAWS
jgi:hypothetical protein